MVEFSIDKNLQQNNVEQFNEYLQEMKDDIEDRENKQEVLLFIKEKNTDKDLYLMISKAENEIRPYDCIKLSNLSQKGFVEQIKVKELLMMESEYKDDLVKASTNLAGKIY